MVLADTVLQLDGASLITGLGTGGTALAGGIVMAAKLITSVVTRLHAENRQDRAELMRIVNSQWEHLNRLAQSSRVTAQAVRSVQKRVGAKSVAGQEDSDQDDAGGP